MMKYKHCTLIILTVDIAYCFPCVHVAYILLNKRNPLQIDKTYILLYDILLISEINHNVGRFDAEGYDAVYQGKRVKYVKNERVDDDNVENM